MRLKIRQVDKPGEVKFVEVSDVHVDAPLSNVSIRYTNGDFIGTQALPEVAVKKESDLYYIYGKENFRIPNRAVRAPKTEPAMIEYTLATTAYQAIEYELADMIDDREKNNADQVLNLEADAVENITDVIRLMQEQRIATLLFTSGNYTNTKTLSGVASAYYWSDTTNGDPVGDIDTARNTIIQEIGKRPNTLVLGYDSYIAAKNHPDLIDRAKYTNLGVITLDLLARIFEVDRVLVGQAVVDSSIESQDASRGYVWTDNALLCYVEPSPGIKKVSLGYSLMARNMRTRRARDEKANSDWFAVGHIVDEKLMAELAGYLIVNTKQ